MKNYFTILLLALLSSTCQQNQAKQHQDAVDDMMKKYGDNKSVDNSQPDPIQVSSDMANSGLMGEWKTVLLTGDSNSNGVLDSEEIEKGITNYNDYLKLNPDGTCEYTQLKLPAHYEIVEKDGNRSIEIIVSDGSRIKQGRIISLKPDELQLMKFSGGRDIIVYKHP